LASVQQDKECRVSKAHVHSFGFGEETCETCGLSFVAIQDNPQLTPCGNSAPMPESIATRQIRHRHHDNSRHSIVGFFRAMLPANYAGKQSTEK
jgi:hypothetical protein